RATLSNGLKVVLVERHEAPIVQLQLLFTGGAGADSQARSGTTAMTLDMLDEGTKTRSALQISARAESLGATFAFGSNGDFAFVGLNALTARLPESLELYADILINPAFPESELPRLKQQMISGIRQRKTDPVGLATRLQPGLVYGADHPYAVFNRVTEDDVAGLTPASLSAFYKRWFRPDLATLLVVGDTNLAHVMPLLEQRFAAWKAPPEPAPTLTVANVPRQTRPRVFLVNRSGAEQSTIVAAHVAQARADPDFIALRATNTVMGGSFLSRINMNLREDKHWSYGAQTQLSEARGPGMFAVVAPVQTDKTAESLTEIRKELQEVTSTRKPDDNEIQVAKNTLVLTLPGNNETVAEISGSYRSILMFGLPDNYWNDFVGKVTALTPMSFSDAAAKLIDVNALTWIIVGDLEKIEAKVRALNLGEVVVLDAEGNRLR
ncbi:MAG TPA: pitrilysin family protein, partial [Steroidobacteraceae bacterium]|nr:pitrilysin family protein [Steroidobacteraceae bacterium]